MRTLKLFTKIVVIALLILAAAVPTYADIGRLFFTPAERDAFERARKVLESGPELEKIDPEPDAMITIIEAVPTESKPTITIDGYVRRSRGTATLWVNGENNYDGDLNASQVDPGTAHLRGGVVRLTPMDGEQAIYLKPGQSYDPNSVVTRDAYETPVIDDEFDTR